MVSVREEETMTDCKFAKTREIINAFEAYRLKYKLVEKETSEAIVAGFEIENGPNVIAYIVVNGEDTPVSFRIFDIVSNISAQKRGRVLEACNILNSSMRYLKYLLVEDGSVQVDYDIPNISDNFESGQLAAAMFVGMMRVADAHYAFLMKALYTDEPLDAGSLYDARDGDKGASLRPAPQNSGMMS